LIHDLEDVSSNPRSGNIFSIYLIEELNQKVNKNKNASNSLVFGHWRQTKTCAITPLCLACLRSARCTPVSLKAFLGPLCGSWAC